MCALTAGKIVWINGCFGVGKTTVAQRLVATWPGAVLFDPELVGTLLRMTLPPDQQMGDYQDMPLWRELTVTIASALARGTVKPIVIPMTLVVPHYFDEIVGGLLRRGIAVTHLTLVASRATIEARLRQRPDTTDWPVAQIDRCLTALKEPRFASSISTEGRSVDQVVAAVREFAEA
jgi:hypothetical protein